MPFSPNGYYPFPQNNGMSTQADYQRQLGTAIAWADYQRRKALRAAQAQQAANCEHCHMPLRPGSAYCTNCGEPVQPPQPAQRGAERPSAAKKIAGIIILIAVAMLILGAVGQAHNNPVMPGGTPGVIRTGANVRTGPGTGNSIATTAPAGTRIVIDCRITTPEGRWDKLTSPYRGLFVRATLVHSHRPARC